MYAYDKIEIGNSHQARAYEPTGFQTQVSEALPIPSHRYLPSGHKPFPSFSKPPLHRLTHPTTAGPSLLSSFFIPSLHPHHHHSPHTCICKVHQPTLWRREFHTSPRGRDASCIFESKGKCMRNE